MKRLGVCSLALLLGACCPTTARTISGCPPLVEYSAPFKAQLAAELHGLGEQSAAAQTIADYVKLRDQLKICRAAP